MTQFIAQGGPFMYLLLAIAAIILALTAWVAVRVRGGEGPDAVLETGIDATLFWGVWALLLGFTGTAVGMYLAAGAISRAGEVNPAVIWGGIHVALTTTLLGLVIFLAAALIWFGLRTWYRRAAAVVPRG